MRKNLEIKSSFVYDVGSCGKRYPVQACNVPETEWERFAKRGESVLMYTGEWHPNLNIPEKLAVKGLIVDKNLVVTGIFRGAEEWRAKASSPEAVLIFLAVGHTVEVVDFLTQNFRVGDIIKVRLDGDSISAVEAENLMNEEQSLPVLLLGGEDMFTTDNARLDIAGKILNLSQEDHATAVITVYDGEQRLRRKETVVLGKNDNGVEESLFRTISLNPGVNYIDVLVNDDKERELCKKTLIVFRRKTDEKVIKQSIMWVEQYVSAQNLNTPEKIGQMINMAREAGVTAFCVDVKGCEGYAAYKKASLTGVPYLTASINPRKQITMEIDFLEEFVKAAHERKCKVYASLNFFVEGKLIHWSQDVYSFDADGQIVFGALYFQWLAFRAGVIRSFAGKLRQIIDEYNRTEGKKVCLAAYVGSWYELYYQNGVNWASANFKYNERLGFPMEKLYKREYSRESYLEYIDFLMSGCYYPTREQIGHYLTLGNIVTNGEIPVIGSISLPDLADRDGQRMGYHACMDSSDGCMIFDLCYVDWDKLRYAMRN